MAHAALPKLVRSLEKTCPERIGRLAVADGTRRLDAWAQALTEWRERLDA